MEKCEQQRWATVTTSGVTKTWNKDTKCCIKCVLFGLAITILIQNGQILGKINQFSKLC